MVDRQPYRARCTEDLTQAGPPPLIGRRAIDWPDTTADLHALAAYREPLDGRSGMRIGLGSWRICVSSQDGKNVLPLDRERINGTIAI